MLRRMAEQHNFAALREACLDTDPSDPGARVLLALALAHLDDAPAARRLLAELDPAALPFDARVDLAAVHMALGELDHAILILEAAQRECTGNALVYARLAWCRLQQDQRSEAVTLYERSLVLRPYMATYLNLLRLYRDGLRLEDMAKCLDAAWSFWAGEQMHWPAEQQRHHSRQLRALQLDLWLTRECQEEAEAWVTGARRSLSEEDWCTLVADLADRLAARSHYAQAEQWLRAGLRHYPQHLALYGCLANLADLQGRSLQAMALVHRAIRLAKAQGVSTDALLIQLANIALPVHINLAREAAEQAQRQIADGIDEASSADHRSNLNLQAELALAGVESRERNHDAAERRYRQVLEHQPNLIPALQGLGQLLMQLGRIDEAIALFERIKVIDPARGHGGLIAARRFPDDTATLQRLEELAHLPTTDSAVRISLLFQLAAAWEKRKDHTRAFKLADQANAAARPLLRYDPMAHRQRCARIRHAFPKALYEHRPNCGHESTLPVFIVGMPRSGTTLVEQIIAGHSRIHGAGELGVIPGVIAGLERWERHAGSGRRYPDCADDLDPAVVRGIADGILRELREYAPEADHVIDKLPHNFENIGLIRLLFPRAKVISVRRDPRDIAISNYFTDYASRHAGMGFAYDLDWIGEQLADHNLLMHHWQQIWPEGILEVHYEDVVDDPEANARRLLEHIGVEWEPQVLDFPALERPVRTASLWQVRQPLYATSKARWQHYRRHLRPLIAATNRKIAWAPIEMASLPEPGWLNAGVDLYRQGDLDAAEYRFKRLLHHIPDHAAAGFMLGLVYVRKGHLDDGVALMERGFERCPWNHNWRKDLAQAYRLGNRHDEATALERSDTDQSASAARHDAPPADLDYLFLSEENTCASPGPARSGNHC